MALPALKASEAASTVTFGRASYMMPMTPIGTRTLRIKRPFGLVHSLMTSPTGSGSSATWRSPRAISATRFSFSMSLSSMSGLMPFALSLSMSAALAASTSAHLSSSASAMASRAAFFCSVVSWATAIPAALAAAALSMSVFIRLPPFPYGRNCPDVLPRSGGPGSGRRPCRCRGPLSPAARRSSN